MRFLMVKNYLFSCIILLTLSLKGQESLVFHHLNTANGLSNNGVTSIIKDQYGFLWIGTDYGLNRYDGYTFKVYLNNLLVPNSLSANTIISLQEDGLGNVWVKTGVNYVIYNRNKDCFNENVQGYLRDLGIKPDATGFEIYVDQKKDLWVINSADVYCYDTKNRKLHYFISGNLLSGLYQSDFGNDGDNLYAVSLTGEILQLNKTTNNISKIELKGDVKVSVTNQRYRLYIDSRHCFWLFSRLNNVVYFKTEQMTAWERLYLNSSVQTQNNVLLDILEDANGNIWFGTDHCGLFIYNPADKSLINYINDYNLKSSLASNNVSCLYKDDKNIIWIGHNKKGLSFFHDSFYNLRRVEYPECRDIDVFCEDKYGNIWIGTDGNGLFLLDKSKGSKLVKQAIPNNAIVSLLAARNGDIWIGTFLNGLFHYSDGKFTHYTTENSNLTVNDIWKIVEDRFGNIWIATLGGGIQCLRADNKRMDSLISIGNDIAYTIDLYYDGGDELYIGTAYGLVIYDIVGGKKVFHFGNKKGTQKFRQMSIPIVYKDNNNHIWLGQSEGLTLWDLGKDTLYFFDKNKGLCDNVIRGILEDDFHNIWVTTSNGVSVISLDKEGIGSLKTTITNFSVKDGLIDNYFNNQAIYKLRNGNILLGSTEGYTIANPNKINIKSQSPAQIIFTGLSIENKEIQIDSIYNGRKILTQPLDQSSMLTFCYKDRLITLEFTTGDLLNADKVKYLYKIEGLTDEWMPAQGNKIKFSSLQPGNYKLFIKASSGDENWGSNVKTLDIKVMPPFYKSIFAFVLYYIFIFLIILFIMYRVRYNNRIKLEQQKQKLERDQEKNLVEMKLRFFTNISHDLRTPLTLILTPLQTILDGPLEEGLRKKLATVNKNAEQLLQLINSLLDFRKLDVGAETLHLQHGDLVEFIKSICTPFYTYSNERKIQFSVIAETQSIQMKFDPDKIRKIMFNLLSNAFKFTPDYGNIEVGIYADPNHAGVKISDTGCGISENDKKHIFERFYQVADDGQKTGSGIGLHIVSEYVKMHGGSITVIDNNPKGSIFEFKIPFKDVVLNDDSDLTDEETENTEIQHEEALPVLLFVDDNVDFCHFMAESLADEYTVIIAHNGLEAIEKLKNNDISIVVSDIMMPVMSGTELCNRIKTNIEWSHIPVILLTARTNEEYKLEAFELGADDYITKPFNFNLLKLRVQKFLDWRSKCHHSFSQKIDISPSEITITSLDEQLIEKAIKYVEDHISDVDFSVEDLGFAVGLSRSHLYKKLMSITGKGPAEFIRIIRLKRARQLMEKSQLQIAEIAYMVGFNSPKRFSINFKHEFGISPTEYLKSLHGTSS